MKQRADYFILVNAKFNNSHWGEENTKYTKDVYRAVVKMLYRYIKKNELDLGKKKAADYVKKKEPVGKAMEFEIEFPVHNWADVGEYEKNIRKTLEAIRVERGKKVFKSDQISFFHDQK